MSNIYYGGSKEKVVDPKGWVKMGTEGTKIHKSDIDFHIIHGARHELFNEIKKYKNQALSLYQKFIKKKSLILSKVHRIRKRSFKQLIYFETMIFKQLFKP